MNSTLGSYSDYYPRMNTEGSVILVPTYHSIERETEESLKKLEAKGWEVWRRFGCSAVDMARARIATDAFLRGYEWLYWVDSDIQFRPDQFEALAAHPDRFCCAPYAQKQSGGHINIKGKDINQESRGFFEVEACGFGFVKTHVSIYQDMIEVSKLPLCQQVPGDRQPLFPFFQPRWWQETDGRQVYYGEDYSFCLHARSLGFTLMADFDIELGHIGKWAFTIRNPL